jgi:hypothetical protein
VVKEATNLISVLEMLAYFALQVAGNTKSNVFDELRDGERGEVIMWLCGMVDGQNALAPADLPVPEYVRIMSESTTTVSDWRYVSTALNNPVLTRELLSPNRLKEKVVNNPQFNAPQSIVTFSSLIDGRDDLFDVQNNVRTFVSLSFPMVHQEIEFVSLQCMLHCMKNKVAGLYYFNDYNFRAEVVAIAHSGLKRIFNGPQKAAVCLWKERTQPPPPASVITLRALPSYSTSTTTWPTCPICP